MDATVLLPVALVAVWRCTRPANVCSALQGRAVEVRPEKDYARRKKTKHPSVPQHSFHSTPVVVVVVVVVDIEEDRQL
jgi:hypothetical protein